MKPRRPSGCIFCGRRPLTKEHAWPRWLRDRVPATDDGRYPVSDTTKGLLQYERSWASTEPTSATVKVVCGSGADTSDLVDACNDGWMSKLESAARPILTPMIDGEAATLSLGEQQILAAWAVKTAMVFEWTHVDTARISAGERRYLRQTGRPPETFTVELAAFYGTWQLNYLRVMGETVEHPDGTFPAATFTFVIGSLVVQVVHDGAPRTEPRPALGIRDNWAQMIFPPCLEAIWPPPYPVVNELLSTFGRRPMLNIVEDLA